MASSKVPIELWDEIFELSDRRTLLSLLRVNRVARVIAERILYRVIRLLSQDGGVPTRLRSLRSLHTTISSRPSAALSVRSLDILEDGLDECMNVFSAVMASMKQLKSLSCYGACAGWWMLQPCCFRLKHFRTGCHDAYALEMFLQAQQELSSLVLQGDLLFTLPATALPHLELLEGCPDIISRLVPGRPLREVVVYGYFHDADSVTSALQLSSRRIESMCIRVKRWDVSPFNTIARALPSLLELHVTADVEQFNAVDLEEVAKNLSALVRLVRLTLISRVNTQFLRLSDLRSEESFITSSLQPRFRDLRSVILSSHMPFLAPRFLAFSPTFPNEWTWTGHVWEPKRVNSRMSNMWQGRTRGDN